MANHDYASAPQNPTVGTVWKRHVGDSSSGIPEFDVRVWDGKQWSPQVDRHHLAPTAGPLSGERPKPIIGRL